VDIVSKTDSHSILSVDPHDKVTGKWKDRVGCADKGECLKAAA
jgi:hypothetical protein